jgi:hypothetical protein
MDLEQIPEEGEIRSDDDMRVERASASKPAQDQSHASEHTGS